jgi:hypothetical protein
MDIIKGSLAHTYQQRITSHNTNSTIPASKDERPRIMIRISTRGISLPNCNQYPPASRLVHNTKQLGNYPLQRATELSTNLHQPASRTTLHCRKPDIHLQTVWCFTSGIFILPCKQSRNSMQTAGRQCPCANRLELH